MPLLPQVEAEAIDPAVLRSMVEHVLSYYWDEDTYFAVVGQEEVDRRRLWPHQSEG